MSFARSVLLPVLLCACRGHPAPGYGGLQPLTPLASLTTDSAVLAQLQQQHPCVGTLPPVYTTTDALPSTVRCTLVVTAAAAIRDLAAAADILPDLRAFRLDRARCAWLRAEAYRNDVTHVIELPRWIVDFPSDRQPSLAVEISRRTGVARVYRQLREFGFTADELCARAK
jgi:hypothetical protein